MASNSGWSKGLPSGSSSIGLGDNDIRSNNSVLQAAWEDEHYFTDGSSGSAGKHKLGSARVYSITSRSQLSNPTGDGNGRIAWNSGGNELWIADGSNSTWTLVTNDLNVGSVNTWSALQVFTGGINSSSTVTFSQDLIASGGGSLTGTWSDLGTVTTVDINGGTIDGSVIGGSTRAAGNFTTLDASSTLSVDGATKLSNTSISNLSVTGNFSVDDITATTVEATTVDAENLRVNSGTSVTKLLVDTRVLNFASINDGTSSTTTFTVTGAAVGDGVFVNQPQVVEASQFVAAGWVSAANVVTLRMTSFEGGGTANLSAHTFHTMVLGF